MSSLSTAPNAELLSINTATLGYRLPPQALVDALAGAGIRNVTFWRNDVAAAGGAASLAAMAHKAGLVVNSLCRGGMFPAATAEERRLRIEDNLRAIDDAAVLGARCLVLVCGGLPEGSKDLSAARTMVRDGIAAVKEHARLQGMKLAIEPLHPMTTADRSCINTLRLALDLCDELDPDMSGDIGVAVDAYHVWWDPEVKQQIARAGAKRLLDYHLCDWLAETTDLVFDRGMMGDGVIDLPQLRGWMHDAGYRGPHDVEIFSKRDWWTRPVEEVLTTCQQRFVSAT